MTNFLEFIEEDIESKKSLLSSMPTSTKTNKRKFNEKVEAFISKYEEYEGAVKKYIEVKSKSFDIVIEKDIENIANTVKGLESTRFILNPLNTYFEKMGFDSILFRFANYQDFKFDSLTELINEFLNKFELIGVVLQSKDFDYTCYVYEFMNAFLDIRSIKTENYDHVGEIFERIYWINPEIIQHIELNFRKLIRKYEKNFIDYISKLQQEAMATVTSYDNCLEKLSLAYSELQRVNQENIGDIIILAKKGEIDINNYFEDSKYRNTTFASLMIDPFDLLSDEVAKNKFYDDLRKLRLNILEFSNYSKFTLLLDDFKNEYFTSKTSEVDKDLSKKLKSLLAQINDNESKLDKLSKRIINGVKPRLFDKGENEVKKLKFESIKYAKELYALYQEYDKEYFRVKVLSRLHDTFTVADFLDLYYSFDYFKKSAIKRVYNINNYNDILEYSDAFDSFASNPLNVIVDGIMFTEENNIAKVIVNKYRLVNIDINEEDLGTDDVNPILEKIDLVLRINEIEKSDTNVEKIWFMMSVAKLLKQENMEN